MKQRFSSLDVSATVADLKQKLIGLRLQNVYDINAKTYLLKFSLPEATGGGKQWVLVESGIRLHSTAFLRDKSITPSSFVVKVRKYLKTKRCTDIRQLGMDRIAVLQFGEGEFTYNFFTEFHSAGNIILTDANLQILTCLRQVVFDTHASTPSENTKVSIAPGQIYHLEVATPFTPITRERLVSLLTKGKVNANILTVLKQGLNVDYSPSVLEHVLALCDIPNDRKLSTWVDAESSEHLEALVDSLMTAFANVDALITGCNTHPQKGWIISKESSITSVSGESSAENSIFMFEEFSPVFLAQYRGMVTDDKSDACQSIQRQEKFTKKAGYSIKEYPHFDVSVDTYFSMLDSQKLEFKAIHAEQNAQHKIENVITVQQERLHSYVSSSIQAEVCARAIEMHLYLVDGALKIVRGCLASGMGWEQVGALVNEQKRLGSMYCKVIEELKLEISIIVLSLPHPDFDDEGEAGCSHQDDDVLSGGNSIPSSISVEVDINQSAYANAAYYYSSKKIAISDHEKAAAVSDKVIALATKKIELDLKSITSQSASALVPVRQPLWFERFFWTITTENYLLLAGQDTTQTNLLLTRYMAPEDVYLSADIAQAPSIVIKNLSAQDPWIQKDSDLPVPPSTLTQASVMALSHSKAWESKVVSHAFWVKPNQVTVDPYSGFIHIIGPKHLFAPVQLAYGFGILFEVDRSCSPSHYADRRPWMRGQPRENLEAVEQATQDLAEVSICAQEDDSSSSGDEDDVRLPFVSDSNPLSDSDIAYLAPVESNLAAVPRPQDLLAKAKDTASPAEDLESSKSGGDEEDFEFPDVVIPDTTSVPPGAVPNFDTNPPSRSLSASSTLAQNTNSAKPASVRGKKGKQKKMKAKYADQSDDEREAMMDFLGSHKGPQPKGKKEKAKALLKQQKEEQEEKRRQVKAARQAQADNREMGGENANQRTAVNLSQDFSAQKHAKKEPVFVDLNAADCLVGYPLPTDTILSAVPMCGPWSSMVGSKFKYKVKLMPGNLKKGKASKSAISYFMTMAESEMSSESSAAASARRERELISQIPEAHCIQLMLGKVKVMTGQSESRRSGKRG